MAYNPACARQVEFAAIDEYFAQCGFRFILLSSIFPHPAHLYPEGA